MTWLGSVLNRERAHKLDAAITARVCDEEAYTWQCPRCGNGLHLVAEHAFSQLWECSKCGYSKVVKQ